MRQFIGVSLNVREICLRLPVDRIERYWRTESVRGTTILMISGDIYEVKETVFEIDSMLTAVGNVVVEAGKDGRGNFEAKVVS